MQSGRFIIVEVELMTAKVTIGSRLKMLRLRNGFTQKILAEAIYNGPHVKTMHEEIIVNSEEVT